MGLAGNQVQVAHHGSAEFGIEEVVAHGEVLGIIPEGGDGIAVPGSALNAGSPGRLAAFG